MANAFYIAQKTREALSDSWQDISEIDTFIRSSIKNEFSDEEVGIDLSDVKIAYDLLVSFGDRIVLRQDVVVASQFSKDAQVKVVDLSSGEKIPENWIVVDIGPKTWENFRQVILNSK
ncbi:phosphoglycerate kinase, partial [Candidatus Nomurabacteria bacterium]|nr:phosphoglycerate kinase [Candidatus Nomurabacteria bacterium]